MPFVQVEAALGMLKLPSESATPEERQEVEIFNGRLKPILPRKYRDLVDEL